MKVRIGFGLGTAGMRGDHERFAGFVDDLERLHFDSVWFSERITGDAPDPLVAMAFTAGRTTKLKLGTSVMVLPGRNPALVATELASLDRLSNGRVLPAFGLGVADPREQSAFGVERRQRAALFDEALPLIRRFWTEDAVTHHGEHFHVEALDVRPKPVQSPPDVWLGGIAPAELRRVGRLGDGWLPSFCTPVDVAAALPVITDAAAAADRTVDPEHIGALVAYCRREIPERLVQVLAARRPDVDPADVVPVGIPALRRQLERFVDVGASKFVLIAAEEPGDWTAELEEVAAELLPMQLAAFH